MRRRLAPWLAVGALLAAAVGVSCRARKGGSPTGDPAVRPDPIVASASASGSTAPPVGYDFPCARVPEPLPFGEHGFWLAGMNAIGHTADGTRWTITPVESTGVERIAPVDGQVAWIVARNSGEGAMPEWMSLRRTVDGGANVVDVSPPGMIGLRSFFGHANARTAFVAASEEGTSKLRLLTTNDGGATWRGVDFAILRPVQSVELTSVDASHTYAMVELSPGATPLGAELFATSDAGAHWVHLPAPPIFGKLRFRDPKNGWMLSSGITTSLTLAWQTTDGGLSWKPLPLTPPLASASDVLDLPVLAGSSEPVFVVSPNAFYGATALGGVLRGSAPLAVPTVDLSRLAHRGSEIWLIDDADVHVLHHSLDAGASWTRDKLVTFTPKRLDVERIEFVSSTRGYVLLHHGDVYRITSTIDGGKTWEPIAAFEEP